MKQVTKKGFICNKYINVNDNAYRVETKKSEVA